MQQNRVKIIGLISVFICAISFPLLNSLFGFVQDSENLENRAMAVKPEFDVEHLDPFPEKYEKFYNDHFTIRALTVKGFNYFNLRAFKKSPFDYMVVIGYNQWLYLTGNLNCYLGTNRLNNEQLERWKKHIDSHRELIEKRGGKFYFLIAPDKSTVYHEHIPYYYYRQNDESIGELLNNYLIKNTKVNVISIFDHMKQQKAPRNIYYKLDNHWNNLGGFHAANFVCKRIAQDFPTVKVSDLSDFSIHTSPVTDGDIWNIIGRPDFYSDVEYDLDRKKDPIKTDPRNYGHYFVRERVSADTTRPDVVVLGDSFTNAFFPFLADGFGRSYHIFDLWKYNLPTETLDKVKPDVYILMIYESLLTTVPSDSL